MRPIILPSISKFARRFLLTCQFVCVVCILKALDHVLTKEVNLRNAVLLRSVFLLAEVGLIDKCHLSYKQKLLGTEEYEYETHDTRKSR